MDGRPGLNLQRALAAFQKAHDLPGNGVLDAQTQQLTEPSTQSLVSYEIAEADVAGPFASAIPAELVEQAKLDALNYKSVLEALAEKFHSSPQLLQRLNPGATFSRAGERVMVPNIELGEAPAFRRAVAQQ